MPLDHTRLKNKFKAILEDEAINETDPAQARENFAAKMATAVIDEIKQAKINYTSGLVAPNGAVTGTINHTIT